MAVSGSGTRRARGGLYGILTLLFAAAVLLCLWLVTALRISYTFVDGSAVIRLRSYQRSIPLAMEEAGIRLGYADEYSAYGSAGQITVRILRSVCVTLEVDGEKSIYTSTGRCVGDLLKQAGIELYAEDILDCDVTDHLSDGMHIKITTVRDSYSGCLFEFVRHPIRLTL